MPMKVEGPPKRTLDRVPASTTDGHQTMERSFNIHVCRELRMYFRVYKNKKALQRVIKLSTPAIVRIHQFKLATIVVERTRTGLQRRSPQAQLAGQLIYMTASWSQASSAPCQQATAGPTSRRLTNAWRAKPASVMSLVCVVERQWTLG
jgi:hypothetical protein